VTTWEYPSPNPRKLRRTPRPHDPAERDLALIAARQARRAARRLKRSRREDES
jgi:hypothetical protein